MNDPEILAWIDSEEGRQWMRMHHKVAVGATHFFTLKNNVESTQPFMHYRNPDEEIILSHRINPAWTIPVAETNMRNHP